MNINAAVMSTAVARETDGVWTVRTPLVGFIAQGNDRKNALVKFIEMLGAFMFAQQRQAQTSRGVGRPSKHYDAHIHVQVQKDVKTRFDGVADQYKLSQSETIVFLLDCLDILQEEFVSDKEMGDAEKQVLQLTGAGAK